MSFDFYKTLQQKYGWITRIYQKLIKIKSYGALIHACVAFPSHRSIKLNILSCKGLQSFLSLKVAEDLDLTTAAQHRNVLSNMCFKS